MSHRASTVALLPSTTITTAGTVAGAVIGESVAALGGALAVTLQAVFTYGSGGTSAKAYVQTTLDAGATWVDVACFAFATTTATKVSGLTSLIAPAAQAFTPSDGALTDNTIIQGVIGSQWRVKLISVGTYAGGTTLVVSMTARG